MTHYNLLLTLDCILGIIISVGDKIPNFRGEG